MSAVRTHSGPAQAFDEGRDVFVSTPVKPAASRGPHPPVETHPVWGFTRSDRGLLAISLVIMAALLGAHVWRDRERMVAPVKVIHPHSEYQFRVALNSATWVEWAQLDGVGEKLARRIVADREERGPFRRPDDLLRVKGIGPKTLEKMRPFLVADSE